VIVVAAPDPVLPVPDAISTLPETPFVAEPEDSLIEPEEPAVEDPVTNDMAPLTPAEPPAAVLTTTAPLDLVVPRSEFKLTEPPVVPEV
jgi:hypothetical protein